MKFPNILITAAPIRIRVCGEYVRENCKFEVAPKNVEFVSIRNRFVAQALEFGAMLLAPRRLEMCPGEEMLGARSGEVPRVKRPAA